MESKHYNDLRRTTTHLLAKIRRPKKTSKRVNKREISTDRKIICMKKARGTAKRVSTVRTVKMIKTKSDDDKPETERALKSWVKGATNTEIMSQITFE